MDLDATEEQFYNASLTRLRVNNSVERSNLLEMSLEEGVEHTPTYVLEVLKMAEQASGS